MPRIPEDILTKNPHLDGYVSRIRDIYGEPEFFEDLTLDMKYLESFNIVYPVGNPVYIHAYARSFSERFYNVIEPQIDPEIISRIDAIFARMAASIDAPEDPLLERSNTTSYMDVWEAIRATYVYPLEDLVERLENGDTSFIPGRKRVEAIAYAEV